MAEILINLWVLSSWKIIVSAVLALFSVILVRKWMNSFDSRGELSAQEKLQSYVVIAVVTVVLTIAIFLMVDHYVG